MSKKLNCNQVCSLLNFFIEGNLSPVLTKGIEEHLKHCPICRKKAQDLDGILSGYLCRKHPDYENPEKFPLSGDFMNNLSAYVDNELNSKQNVRIKKLTISNPAAREKLYRMYNFRQLLKSAYNSTKNNIKFDCSKQVMSKLQNAQTYSTDCFNKLAVVFSLIILGILMGFLYLYF